ncbi:MAG: MlaD family protein [bacterium]|nr:MlaD family protein [bacterium]
MKLTNETKLGIVVSAVAIIFILIVIFLGKLNFSEKGYTLKVRFTFVGDLKMDAPVIFAGGIRVGKVVNIQPLKDLVEVTIQINKNFRIKSGNEIVIYTQGLLGEKYININGYDGPGELLKDGDIVTGVDPVSLDAMSIKMVKLMKGVFGPTLTDEEVKRSFSSLFNNAGDFAYNLDMLIKENRQNIFVTIKNLKSTAEALDLNLSSVLKEISGLSKDIAQISQENQESINKTIKNLETTSKQLNATITELQRSSENLEKITSAVKNREGTIGKLIYEKRLYDSLLITSKNLEIFSQQISKNPRSLLFGK